MKSLPSILAVELKNDANQSAFNKTNLSRQLLQRQWNWVISLKFYNFKIDVGLTGNISYYS